MPDVCRWAVAADPPVPRKMKRIAARSRIACATAPIPTKFSAAGTYFLLREVAACDTAHRQARIGTVVIRRPDARLLHVLHVVVRKQVIVRATKAGDVLRLGVFVVAGPLH